MPLTRRRWRWRRRFNTPYTVERFQPLHAEPRALNLATGKVLVDCRTKVVGVPQNIV